MLHVRVAAGIERVPAAVGTSLFTKNRATFLPQPRIGVAWRPFDKDTVDPRRRRRVQRSAGRARAIAPTRTRPSTRPTRSGPRASRTSSEPAGTPIQPGAAAAERAARAAAARRRPAGHVHADARRVLGPRRARAVGQHVAERRLRRAATATTRSSASTPTRPCRSSVPGVAVPRDVPDHRRSVDGTAGLRRARGTAGAGRHVFQPDRNQAESRARQHLDVDLRGQAARTTRCKSM